MLQGPPYNLFRFYHISISHKSRTIYAVNLFHNRNLYNIQSQVSQSEIGNFADEKAAKKLDLTEADHKVYLKNIYLFIHSIL